MVQIISGKKGKGKTKYLLDSVNGAVASAQVRQQSTCTN